MVGLFCLDSFAADIAAVFLDPELHFPTGHVNVPKFAGTCDHIYCMCGIAVTMFLLYPYLSQS